MPDTLDRVVELAPRIAKRAPEIEEARRLPADLVDDLAGAGCFRMFVPTTHGGDDLSLAEGVRVIEELSRADGSTGWTVMIGALSASMLAYLPRSTYDEILGPGPDARVAGAIAPKGTATEVAGGYRVSGRWPFASGCTHAAWVGGNCVVLRGGEPVLVDGSPRTVVALFPVDEVDILDTWHVAGLAGTGSHDFGVEDRFCPSERTYDLFAAVPCADSAVVRIPILQAAALATAAVAVGIAVAALDDVATLARSGKQPAFGPARLAELPGFQRDLGEADARLRAARALLHAESEGVSAKAAAGVPLTLDERARLMATGSYVSAEATAVGDRAFALAGSNALYAASPLQRRLRDLHVMGQHVVVSRDHYATAGAALAGAPVHTALV